MTKDIIQGGKCNLVARIVAKNGDPINLTGVTALKACFDNLDGTELVLTLGAGISIASALFGKILISLTAAQTALLRDVQSATLEVSITFPTDLVNPVKVRIPEAYNVLQSEC